MIFLVKTIFTLTWFHATEHQTDTLTDTWNHADLALFICSATSSASAIDLIALRSWNSLANTHAHAERISDTSDAAYVFLTCTQPSFKHEWVDKSRSRSPFGFHSFVLFRSPSRLTLTKSAMFSCVPSSVFCCALNFSEAKFCFSKSVSSICSKIRSLHKIEMFRTRLTVFVKARDGFRTGSHFVAIFNFQFLLFSYLVSIALRHPALPPTIRHVWRKPLANAKHDSKTRIRIGQKHKRLLIVL